jgi:hypothetical protein
MEENKLHKLLIKDKILLKLSLILKLRIKSLRFQILDLKNGNYKKTHRLFHINHQKNISLMIYILI